jgi:hypothetical protein
MNKSYLLVLIFLSYINCKTSNPKLSKQTVKLALRKRMRVRKRLVKAKIEKQQSTEKKENPNAQAQNNQLNRFNEPKNQSIFKISSPTNPNWSVGFEVAYTDNGSVTYPQQLNKFDYNPNNPYGINYRNNYGSSLHSFNN